MDNVRKPELIMIAGPNGSGKTSVTQKFLHHSHDVPITKIISRFYKSILNCEIIAKFVDRLYVYDNSVDGRDAMPLFRLTNGVLGKLYVKNVPEWAINILPETDEVQIQDTAISD